MDPAGLTAACSGPAAGHLRLLQPQRGRWPLKPTVRHSRPPLPRNDGVPMSSVPSVVTALGAVAVLVLCAGETRAQTYQDSLSIARAVLDYNDARISELSSGEKCGDLPCTPEQIVADWRKLQGAHNHPSSDPPPCRLEQGSAPGSRLTIGNLTIGPLNAAAFRAYECTNPPGRAHRVFAWGGELFLEKRDGRWQVVREGVQFITWELQGGSGRAKGLV